MMESLIIHGAIESKKLPDPSIILTAPCFAIGIEEWNFGV
jgi:hypothetical protein